ncbi:MAG: hypothetical protein ACRDIV_04990 [Ktedonobacteraceae bacterium]
MDETGGKSEVARVLRQIEMEQEAAGRGMYGFASQPRCSIVWHILEQICRWYS